KQERNVSLRKPVQTDREREPVAPSFVSIFVRTAAAGMAAQPLRDRRSTRRRVRHFAVSGEIG
ncbi:hypothetical protein, partial [Aeromonas veronii]|uniref:hypothetical protein n=1 Tax=Aeromonas veronii TaxID=654 RepID=UPI001A8C8931